MPWKIRNVIHKRAMHRFEYSFQTLAFCATPPIRMQSSIFALSLANGLSLIRIKIANGHATTLNWPWHFKSRVSVELIFVLFGGRFQL